MRSAARRASRSTTSRRGPIRSSRRRCSGPTNGVSAPSRCPASSGWPSCTGCRPTSCCLAGGHDLEIDLTDPIGALGDGFTIDLVRLHEIDDDDAAVIARYAATIQLQRQDFNGQMLTIRSDDLRVLAAVMGRSPEDLGSRLDELGLRAGLRLTSRRRSVPDAIRRRRTGGDRPRLRSSRRASTVVDPGQDPRSGQPPHGGPARPARRIAAPGAGRVPRHDPRAGQRDHHQRRRGRGRAGRPALRGDGRAARGRPRARPRRASAGASRC